MSQENVEVIRRMYDGLVARPGALQELLDPDYEMDLTDVDADVGLVRGYEAADEVLRPYWETFVDFRYEIEEVIHADERQVVTAVREGGHMRDSDSEVWDRVFNVWTLRDGRVVRVSGHLEKSQALEAAGLSE